MKYFGKELILPSKKVSSIIILTQKFIWIIYSLIIVICLPVLGAELDSQGNRIVTGKFDSKKWTFIHQVTKLRLWKKQFEPTILDTQKLPSAWFSTSSEAVFFTWTDQVDLTASSLDLKSIMKDAWYPSDLEIHYITLFANFKSNTVWLGTIWETWLPKNIHRNNSFSNRHVKVLQGLGLPWHSEFYNSFNIAGFVEGGSAQVVNPKQIESWWLIIPSDLSSTNVRIDIKSSFSCKATLARLRNL